MRTQHGFTFPEVIVILGIVAVLFGIVTVSLLRIQRSPQVRTTATILMTDIKSQQLKAMMGDTQGTGVRELYGVAVEPSQYVLFRGNTYIPENPTNAPVEFGPSLLASTTIPGGTLLFAKGSGEIIGHIDGADTVTLTNIDNGQAVTLRVNEYGVVTELP
ncbi:MAG: prepilin-type N-terminal cleavage/methylation domain-containing protein [Patescibacteria group bacterium]